MWLLRFGTSNAAEETLRNEAVKMGLDDPLRIVCAHIHICLSLSLFCLSLFFSLSLSPSLPISIVSCTHIDCLMYPYLSCICTYIFTCMYIYSLQRNRDHGPRRPRSEMCVPIYIHFALPLSLSQLSLFPFLFVLILLFTYICHINIKYL